MARLVRVIASLVMGAAAATAVLTIGGAQVAGTVTVDLQPVAGASASGSAALAATADGSGTLVDLEMSGLTADATYTVSMHAGTCEQPSASFSALPSLTADADGTATAGGDVRFRGTDPVTLDTMADGEHVIAVADAAGIVACGVIAVPAMAPAATGGAGLAGGGGSVPLTLGALALAATLAAAGGARRLTGHRRS